MASVSVVIPVFNGAATIARAIESVLAQDYRDEYEIIVSDDGSTDDTPSILARFQGRIRVTRQSNRGAAAARNAGVATCSSELLAFLDADDTWMPPKLRKMVPVIQNFPQAALIYSDAIEVDENDQPMAQS